jgi:hypothetical protein
MPIKVKCPNGHSLMVTEKHAGTQIRCPKCRQAVEVPSLSPQLEPPAPVDPWEETQETRSPAKRPASEMEEFEVLEEEEVDEFEPLERSRPSKKKSRSKDNQTNRRSSEETDHDAVMGKVVMLGGAVGLLVTLGLVFWLIWGRNPPAPAPVAVQPAAAPEVVQQPPVEVPVAPVAPEKPVPPPLPRLSRNDIAANVHTFQLPGRTWAFAYDEVTSRFAVTHDQAGILIFDLDQAEKNQLEAIAKFPTPSLPMAVCLKAVDDKRWFVFASEKEHQLQIIDADTLELQTPVPVEPGPSIKAIVGSADPADTYVYYSHIDGIHRLDLRTKVRQKIEYKSAYNASQEIVMSSDGMTIYFGTGSGGRGEIMRLRERGDTKWTMIGGWELPNSGEPLPIRLKDRMAIGRFVTSSETRAKFAELTYEPCLEFQNRPLLVGVRDRQTVQRMKVDQTRRPVKSDEIQPALVVASANDLRELQSIPLPIDWRYEHVKHRDPDPRNEWGTSHGLKFTMCESLADNRRNWGLICVSDYLLVIPMDQLPESTEPALSITSSIPRQVQVGQLVEIPMNATPAGATTEIVLDSNGMHSVYGYGGKLRILGVKLDPAEEGKTLQLEADMLLKQKILYVRETSLVEKLPLPFQIRIDEEIMTVTSIDDFKGVLTVERTDPKVHRTSSPVYIINPADKSAVEVPRDLAEIQDGVFRWTPSQKQVGDNVVRLRAKFGEYQHDWLWEFEVVAESAQAN